MREIETDKKMHSGIQYLRIIMMIWIIMFHYVNKGTVLLQEKTVSFYWIILAFCNLGGAIGNVVFVLISGYLLFEKSFKVKRIIMLWSEVLFFSIFFWIISLILSGGGWKANLYGGIIETVFPVVSNKYWFISTYIILYLVSPFINIMLKYLNKTQHLYLSILTLILFSIMPTIHISWITGGSNLPIFICLYILGAYIKRYSIRELNNRFNIVFFVFFCVIGCISQIILRIINFSNITYFTWGMDKTTVIIPGILIFLVFINITPPMPLVLERCAQSTFGVYLIHISCHHWLFKGVFDNARLYGSIWMPLHILVSTFLIYIGCVVLDQARIHIIAQRVGRKVSQIVDKVTRKNTIF